MLFLRFFHQIPQIPPAARKQPAMMSCNGVFIPQNHIHK